MLRDVRETGRNLKCTMEPDQTIQNYQVHQKQGKSEKLSQSRTD